MASTLVIPKIERIIGGLERRILNLERRIHFRDTAQAREVIFTLPGAVSPSTSPKFYVRDGGVVTSILCSLGTAGTTTTTIQIKRTGGVAATITMAAGVALARAVPQIGFGADQEPLTVTVSGAGTGAQDLTVQVRFG